MNPNPNPGESRKQILDDHREIGELLSTLANVTAATETTKCLNRLLPLLQRHFKEEEDEIDGLHAVIQTQAPHRMAALLELKQEHTELLEQVKHFLSVAEQTEGHNPKLRDLGLKLKSQLTAHEAKETEIFVDSIWTDLGAGD